MNTKSVAKKKTNGTKTTTAPKLRAVESESAKPQSFKEKIAAVYAYRGTSPAHVIGTVAEELLRLILANEDKDGQSGYGLRDEDVRLLLECRDLLEAVKEEIEAAEVPS